MPVQDLTDADAWAEDRRRTSGNLPGLRHEVISGRATVRAARSVHQTGDTTMAFGDNEEAWRRAETFIVGQILTVPQN